MDKDKLTDSIKDVADNIMQRVAKDEQQAFVEFDSLHDLSRARKAIKTLQPSDFSFETKWPHEKVMRGFLGSYFPDNNRLIFLFTHYDFIEGHFGNVFKDAEGYSSYMDKTRNALRRLARHLYDGTQIAFEPGSYSSPTRVLKDQDTIVDFFEALLKMYYGNGRRYAEIYTDFQKLSADN